MAGICTPHIPIGIPHAFSDQKNTRSSPLRLAIVLELEEVPRTQRSSPLTGSGSTRGTPKKLGSTFGRRVHDTNTHKGDCAIYNFLLRHRSTRDSDPATYKGTTPAQKYPCPFFLQDFIGSSVRLNSQGYGVVQNV